ncbi:MAG: hypothetical protein A2806_02350 [Candidatus Terrybacteria bacterium RIFCSPHIGHO2_01_FULL_48_17]|uniref:HNH nuclease domain-containing protein n=1 Tax=Candidatus Terrybacteria bacterium RIFCSPHIGHO2_01_FULL_48_17 TaxID=1802362 RepID=A0A1G2PJA7_9BACT|nr:MAG: hypothetical protein A2806_02350 [Candidatus Terrybacteria bacterium RIFCSPHIGHO2_01_FULL_48_17]OHA53583.1 MAG: hypothetical protein A3A30_00305 [Candidatus Terrybacteria bacterium RIFCSPLOWO2_01_FULL_48_14]
MVDKRRYRDRAEYNKQAVAKRRRKLKLLAIEYLGGKCLACGYTRCAAAFDIHHRNPQKKEFGLSTKGLTRSWARIKNELEKCILLCANCHREIHVGFRNLPKHLH